MPISANWSSKNTCLALLIISIMTRGRSRDKVDHWRYFLKIQPLIVTFSFEEGFMKVSLRFIAQKELTSSRFHFHFWWLLMIIDFFSHFKRVLSGSRNYIKSTTNIFLFELPLRFICSNIYFLNIFIFCFNTICFLTCFQIIFQCNIYLPFFTC